MERIAWLLLETKLNLNRQPSITDCCFHFNLSIGNTRCLFKISIFESSWARHRGQIVNIWLRYDSSNLSYQLIIWKDTILELDDGRNMLFSMNMTRILGSKLIIYTLHNWLLFIISSYSAYEHWIQFHFESSSHYIDKSCRMEIIYQLRK